MQKISLTLFILFSAVNVFSQGIIRGIILDNRKDVVPFANVILKKAADSSIYKLELSNETGNFLFEQIPIGDYFIEILNLGYEKKIVNDISITNDFLEINFRGLYLKNSGISLEAVTITTDKVFISRKFDKTIVDIENSTIHNGSSLIEVLEKLPNVQVNQDGAIKLKGKPGVTIMINGKQTYMSQADLTAMLQSMSSNNVQKIELSNNPTANYDAAGNAGIINIVTKKSTRDGFNGTIKLNYGQGRYTKTNNSFSIYLKEKRFNFYFAFNYAYRKGFVDLTINRKFYNGDTLIRAFMTHTYFKMPLNNYNPNLVLDFNLSKKTTLSVLGNSSFYNINPISINHTNMFNGSDFKTGSYDFIDKTKDNSSNYYLNLQLKHDFDSTGKQLKMDLDYSRFLNNKNQNFENINYDNADLILNRSTLIGYPKKDLSVYSAKLDYTQTLFKDIVFETGIKSSVVNADYDIKFYNSISNTLFFDSTISNHFIYTENINAGYINLKRESEKMDLSLGIRAEQTLGNGLQKYTNTQFTRSFFQWFPTLILNYKLTNKHALNLTSNKRIDRPSYESLNPFKNYIDILHQNSGNPYLLPEISYNAELGYSFKEMFFISFGYTYVKNPITSVFLKIGNEGRSFLMPININQSEFYNLNLSSSNKITNWWSMDNSSLIYYSSYAGAINSYNLNSNRISFNFSTNNRFRISDDFSAELNFFYNHRNLAGFTLYRESSNLSIGFQKSLFKKQGSIAINVSDLFLKNYYWGEAFTGEIRENFITKRDTRVVNITFNYRFGKGKAKRMRKDGGAIEENQRAGGI